MLYQLSYGGTCFDQSGPFIAAKATTDKSPPLANFCWQAQFGCLAGMQVERVCESLSEFWDWPASCR